MHRARNRKGRFVSRARRIHRRRRLNDPGPRLRRRSFRRRRSSSAARPRRHFRRRRHNPGIMRGIALPAMQDALGGVVGAVGAKYVAKTFVKQATGFWQPVATFAVGLGLAFVANMVPVPFVKRLAKPMALGATIIAGIDALHLTPLGATLGSYYVPSGYTPVLSSGMGDFPAGFATPQLSYGDMNQPTGFSPEEDLGYGY